MFTLRGSAGPRLKLVHDLCLLLQFISDAKARNHASPGFELKRQPETR